MQLHTVKLRFIQERMQGKRAILKVIHLELCLDMVLNSFAFHS